MSKLSELLNNVLSSIAKLSDEELQAEFDACKNGSVGRAILEGQSFMEEYFDSHLKEETAFFVNSKIDIELSDYLYLDYKLNSNLNIEKLAANDDNYLMAA